MMDEYVGVYFSQEWVKKKILNMNDKDIEEMQKQMDSEGDQDIDADLMD